jgi:hypothetical protein
VQPLLQREGNNVLRILSVCLCDHAKNMRHAILPSVACQVLPYFSTLTYKRKELRKNSIKYKMCVLILSTNIVRNIPYCKNNSARYYHKCTQTYEYIFQLKLNFLHVFLKKFSNINFHENPSSWNRVVPQGRTEGQKAFRNFEKSA